MVELNDPLLCLIGDQVLLNIKYGTETLQARDRIFEEQLLMAI